MNLSLSQTLRAQQYMRSVSIHTVRLAVISLAYHRCNVNETRAQCMACTPLSANTCPITKSAKHTTAHQIRSRKSGHLLYNCMSTGSKSNGSSGDHASCMMHGARQGLGSVADAYLDTTAICLALLLMHGKCIMSVTTIALL